MSYEINVLVNGSRCKQYSHNGKLFIEAKKGSEYSIEVKNNTWQRILAVCSVDGLDILSGKTATENGNGYVINGNGSLKADGFRVSDEKVAKFLFDYKGGSYAASKEDGSERNVGVIGVRIFTEKVKPPPPAPIIVKEEHHHHHDHYPTYPYPTNPYKPWWDQPTIWGSGDTIRYGNSTCNTGDSGPTMNCCDFNSVADDCLYDRSISSAAPGATRSANNHTKGSTLGFRANKLSSPVRSMNAVPQPEALGFDMGTKWGEAKESRVIEVEFEKGILALTTNIYYASRQSLVEMGVPLGNEKQVSFPEPFADGKYAKPPRGWNG